MAKKGPSERDRIIGRNLRRWRLERELTQTELGDYLGLTFQQVQKYEKGTNRLSGGTIVQVCNFLQITAQQLLGVDGEPVRGADAIFELGESKQGIQLARAFLAIEGIAHRNLVLDMAEALAGHPGRAAKAVHIMQRAAVGT